jgi:hypothetical protein
VDIEFPLELRVEQKTEQVDGPQNAGEIYHTNWFALSRGPLVFSANGLIDGKDRERALEIDLKNAVSLFSPVQAPEGMSSPAYELKVPGMQPLLFVPYFEAGGMKKGGWRLTWLQTQMD